MNWSLRGCARHGHVTYAPYEKDLRDRLRASTMAGEAWRCLRCGDFTLGAAQASGPAEDAPLLLRGPELRDALVLRLLAVERGVRGLLIVALAYGVYRFSNAKASISKVFEEDLPLLHPLADKLGYNLDDSGVVSIIRSLLAAQHSTLELVAGGLLAYGTLQVIEAVGLWRLKRWGEYFAVVATSLFLPLEIYELIEKVTITRVGALTINLLAVAYLLLSKRLFGLRGGKAAYDAKRHSKSLIEVESAAVRTDFTQPTRKAARQAARGISH
ncbi:MAG: DUF2127 domain-containing protein [Actinomycetota bacterium]|nr:DUF2127 domain-containing protein [Actinomycetota bacterium]